MVGGGNLSVELDVPDNLDKDTIATRISDWINTLTIDTFISLVITHSFGFYHVRLRYSQLNCLSLGSSATGSVGLGVITEGIHTVTFTMMVNTSDVTKNSSECLWYNGLHGTDGYGLYMGGGAGATGKKTFAILANGKWWKGWATGMEWIADQWQHIGLTFTYLSPTGITIKLYIDGELVYTSTGTNPLTPSTQAYLATNADSPLRYLRNTKIKEFRAWNRVLSDDEIAADMEASTPDTNDLILWYPMNEGSGVTLNDGSVSENDGTISGSGISWSED